MSLQIKEYKFAQSGLFRFLGRESYNIYLWHMLILLAVEYVMRGITVNIAFALIIRALFVSVGTATALFCWEKVKRLKKA